MDADQPWRADHRLDAVQAAALIAEQFPEFASARAELLGEGWDGVVFLVDGEWAFRFPKRADVVPFHERERALLDALAPRLSLPVPVVRHVGRPSPAFPLRYSGYRLIPGVSADVAPEPADVAAVGAEFGRFLAELHAFPCDEARALGFTERQADPQWTRLRDAARAGLVAAATAAGDDFARRCRAVVDDESLVPAPYEGAPRLLHGDLGVEHLLVSADGARAAGVIDWADAHLGDPAGDFDGLWQWAGTALVDAALSAYGGDVAGFAQRARYGGFLVALNNLRYGVEAQRPVYVTAARRALARGLAEFARR